jgi:hypothetical protein
MRLAAIYHNHAILFFLNLKCCTLEIINDLKDKESTDPKLQQEHINNAILSAEAVSIRNNFFTFIAYISMYVRPNKHTQESYD